MKSFFKKYYKNEIFRKYYKNEKGATAVEYAMIIGLIALFAFAAYKALGKEVHRIIVWMKFKFMTIHAGPE